MIQCTFENGSKTNLRHCVVDILIISEGKILLQKRAPYLVQGGKWALAGGYVDLNENIIETVYREAKEETGYEIKIEKFLTVIHNPNRNNEDRQNIAFLFVASPLKKIGESDKEVTELKWFNLDTLPPDEEIAFDHKQHIDLYKRSLIEEIEPLTPYLLRNDIPKEQRLPL